MAQDLRKLFEKERQEDKYAMKDGHEERFLKRLETALPKESKPAFPWFKIAASVLVVIGLAFLVNRQFDSKNSEEPTVVTVDKETDNTTKISLGDLSPNLKKVEEYYMASINLELSELKISDDNKALIESYMKQLSELDKEYQRLNIELNELGPNDQTITALIQNLQLRLDLLQQLKKKLNQLKTSKNEQVQTNIV